MSQPSVKKRHTEIRHLQLLIIILFINITILFALNIYLAINKDFSPLIKVIIIAFLFILFIVPGFSMYSLFNILNYELIQLRIKFENESEITIENRSVDR